jgi:hypothetical protein
MVTAAILSSVVLKYAQRRSDLELELAKLHVGSGGTASVGESAPKAQPAHNASEDVNQDGRRHCDPCAMLFALIQSQEVYHRHKEHMAWLGTALWITGAASFVLVPQNSWNGYSPKGLLYTAMITAGAAGFAFVRFQFKRREMAAALSNACINVATTWISNGPTAKDLEARSVDKGINVPSAVADEVKDQLETWKQSWFAGPRFSEYLTYVVMAVFAVMVIIRAASVL